MLCYRVELLSPEGFRAPPFTRLTGDRAVSYRPLLRRAEATCASTHIPAADPRCPCGLYAVTDPRELGLLLDFLVSVPHSSVPVVTTGDLHGVTDPPASSRRFEVVTTPLGRSVAGDPPTTVRGHTFTARTVYVDAADGLSRTRTADGVPIVPVTALRGSLGSLRWADRQTSTATRPRWGKARW